MLEQRSYIENIMKDALEKAGIEYEEQFVIHERPGDFTPKYTLDFLISIGKFRIDVECDGAGYHSAYADVQKDKYRDAWLLKNKIVDKVLRYNTDQIMNNIQSCIREIVAVLSIETNKKCVTDNNVCDLTAQSYRSYIMHTRATGLVLHKVDIHTATIAYSYDIKRSGAIAFRLTDRTMNKSSAIFSLACSGMNRKDSMAVVILQALLKMKKPAYLTIYTESRWIDKCGNERFFESYNKQSNRQIWNAIGVELSKHNYRFIFQPELKRSLNPSYTVVTKNDTIYRQLKSKARKELYTGTTLTPINEVIAKLLG